MDEGVSGQVGRGPHLGRDLGQWVTVAPGLWSWAGSCCPEAGTWTPRATRLPVGKLMPAQPEPQSRHSAGEDRRTPGFQ